VTRLPTQRAVAQHDGVRTPRWAPLAALAVLACLVACAPGAARPPAAVDRTVTLSTRDGERTALVHHPAAARTGAPLVVVLHGARGSAADVRANLGWDGLADRAGFVVAYPDGLDRTWNAGACCGSARDRGVDDVGFLDALVGAVPGTGPVYAVGFSNGAMMAYAWACARPGALAGVGAVAGARTVDCPAPAPLTVVAVHGTADERVPIGGGRGPSGVVFPSLEASLAPFRAAAACPAAAPADASPARVDDRACAGGHHVVSDVLTGIPHVWPGVGRDPGSGDGPLDATGFLWARLRE
jgi:polyhydroxybutyrate depolymerase